MVEVAGPGVPMGGAVVLEMEGASYRYRGSGGRGRGRGRGAVAASERAGRVIGPVGLRIHRGERVAMIGPNGSGKSTLLHMIAGATSPESGSIRWFGRPGIDRARARIGVVFQSPALDAMLTVGESLLTAGRLMGLSRAEASGRAVELAEALGFSGRMGERVGRLSGGLTRRVDLARALLHGPELLLLDEATAGLDDESRGAFHAALDRLGAGGVTVISATHGLDELAGADRLVVMIEGRLGIDASGGELEGLLTAPALHAEHTTPRAAERLIGLGAAPSAGGRWRLALDGFDERELGPLISELARLGARVSLGRPSMLDLFRVAESRLTSPTERGPRP